jgi:hypothetical protein
VRGNNKDVVIYYRNLPLCHLPVNVIDAEKLAMEFISSLCNNTFGDYGVTGMILVGL